MDYFMLLADRAASLQGKPFLYVDEEQYSYAAFLAITEKKAQELLRLVGEDGISGDVLVLADSFLAQAVLFFAVQKIGARPILLHHGLATEEVEAIAGENALGLWVREHGGKPEIRRFSRPSDSRETEDCLGVLSSGSTGVPKVMHRTFESWAGFFPVQNKIFRVKEDSVLFLHGSLSFTGNMNTFLAVLFAGGTVCTSRRTAVKSWLSLLGRGAIDVVYLVPAKLRLLMEALAANGGRLPAVKSLFAGSQLISAPLLELLREKLPNARILLYYGASELNYITYADCTDGVRDERNLGRPFPGVELSFRDGTIYVDTRFHVSGLKTPFTLRDKGHPNARGELIFEGRAQAWVNKGGYKISLERLELKIKGVAGVRDAAVLSVEDEARGAEIAAFVVREESVSEAELRRRIRHALEPIEMPRGLLFCGAIPLNDRGKTATRILLEKWEKVRSEERPPA